MAKQPNTEVIYFFPATYSKVIAASEDEYIIGGGRVYRIVENDMECYNKKHIPEEHLIFFEATESKYDNLVTPIKPFRTYQEIWLLFKTDREGFISWQEKNGFDPYL